MAARMGVRAGHRVISVDRVPERLARVKAFGAETINLDEAKGNGGVAEMVRELTNGRGADSVIDAVGMEAHGSPVAQGIQKFRSEEHTSELQSLMRISYAVFCLKKKTQ